MNEKDMDFIYEIVGLTALYTWGCLDLNNTVKLYKQKLENYQRTKCNH